MKIKNNLILTCAAAMLSLCVNTITLKAQETPTDTLARAVNRLNDDVAILKKIKLSGFIQAQWQVADSTGAKSFAGGDFPATTNNRFKVRRAEFKTMYDNIKMQIVANINISQDGVTIKDAYGRYNEQMLKMFSLTVGIFNRPFGFENTYSSSLIESPERARMIQVLLPGERDCGAMLTFQMPANSALHPLKIEGGLFNGTGNAANDFDYYKDFIGNIHWNSTNKSEKIKYGIGVSYYEGGIRQGSNKVYSIKADSNGTNSFLAFKDTTNNGGIARRQYFGADGQISVDFPFGITTLRAEYIMGQQPGTSSSSNSPDKSTAAPTGDTYLRNFNGAYFYFVQNIMQSKHAIVVKYDWYDGNTDVSGDVIGKSVLPFKGSSYSKTSTADLKYTTLGLGYILKVDNNLKFTLYYDMVTNENSINLASSGYWKDVKDNVLTIRAQYKF